MTSSWLICNYNASGAKSKMKRKEQDGKVLICLLWWGNGGNSSRTEKIHGCLDELV
jgi:hypothetical protein